MMNSAFTDIVLRCTAAGLMAAVAGCASLSTADHLQPVPAHRVPQRLLGRPRQEMHQVSLARLRCMPTEEYRLSAGDVLGVYVETILGRAEEAPPVHFPEDGNREPAIGYPIPIRADGTIALPLIPPISASGLTVTQLTNAVQRAYTVDRRMLPRGQNRIIVTLIRKHTERILVVREEGGVISTVGMSREAIKRGAGYIIDLPAGQNDLLHALNQTGGLPGLDAKNEVIIVRTNQLEAAAYDQFVAQLSECREPCTCPPVLPDAPGVVRIPLRYFPEDVPAFTEADITLLTGDIVLIQSRDREKFYTGGVLGGGEIPLPRDEDLDVLEAVAIARGPIGDSGAVLSQVNQSGAGIARGGGPLPPTTAIIVRKTCGGGQIPIQIDLKRALADPQQRVILQPEDVLIVKYKPHEEIFNTLLSLIQFNFLFNGLTGNGF